MKLAKTLCYGICAVIGIFAMLFADIEIKNLLSFIGRGLLFWIIAEIVVLVFTLFINKKSNVKMDEDEIKRFIIVYFIFNTMTLIIRALTMEGSTKILGIIVGFFLFNILPIIFTSPGANRYSKIKFGSHVNDKDTGIKTHIIYDQFGNKVATSNTYNDGISGVEKTYVKDNLGNTISESTTIDGYTKTKINTKGRF